jgi:adenosylcobyric acid synthase
VPAEDSLDLEHLGDGARDHVIDIAVIRLPRIANFDDLEPLAAEPGVRVRLAHRPVDLDGADLVVVPGSKTTMADLAWLRGRGLAGAIAAVAAAGGAVLGICGGYQMLGVSLRDPARVESSIGEMAGLGLLPVETTFDRCKTVVRVEATGATTSRLFGTASGAFEAYEIHAGRTTAGEALGRRAAPVFRLLARGGRAVADVDGAVGAGGNVEGTYLHGIFGSPEVRRSLLARVAARRGVPVDPRWGEPPAIDRYDRLADIVSAAVDVPAIGRLVDLAIPRRGS